MILHHVSIVINSLIIEHRGANAESYFYGMLVSELTIEGLEKTLLSVYIVSIMIHLFIVLCLLNLRAITHVLCV